jgi:hypothetical protein
MGLGGASMVRIFETPKRWNGIFLILASYESRNFMGS